MVLVTDTLWEAVGSFLPDDIDSDLMKNLVTVEAELSDMTAGDLCPRPERGLAIALHYAKQGNPTILIGTREYDELPEWHCFVQMANAAFCERALLSKEVFFSAIKKVLPEIKGENGKL